MAKRRKSARFEPFDSLIDLAAAATLDYIAASHREKYGKKRSSKVNPYAAAGAAMGLGKLNSTDDVLKLGGMLGGMLGAMGTFDANGEPSYRVSNTHYAWRLNCEDGSDYGIDPGDYETRTEYNSALYAAKQLTPGSAPRSAPVKPSLSKRETSAPPVAKESVVVCRVSLLQTGQNSDYLANRESLKVGDRVTVQSGSEIEEGIILSIEQRVIDEDFDASKVGKIVAKSNV